MDDHFHCLDGENTESSIRDESIKISDVIEVIETDPYFAQQQSPTTKCNAQTVLPTSTGITGMLQQQDAGAGPSNGGRRPHPAAVVRIVEQPAAKALRFRYECEGRSAGSIPGANSTPENKTFPTIRIEGYQGRAVVVVSCVTKDPPYRPHPHNLVGREGCKKGVCTLEVSPETMSVQFSNLGIQCIKKKEIESALKTREEIRVDPFRTGFSHRSQPTSIDLNAVRLAFQVFLQNEKSKGFTHPLSPIVSEPIYDKKAMTDLNIIKMSDCNSPVDGGHKDIILLCEKVAKEDIQVRFYEEKDGVITWEAFGDFQPSQVHKQTAIWFRTPRYQTLDITEPVRVNIQLRRPSDGATSVPLPFEMLPLDADPGVLKRKRQKFESDPSNSVLRHFQDHEKNRHIQIANDMIKHEPRDTSPAPYMFSPVYMPNPAISPNPYGMYRNPVVDTLGPTPPPADLNPLYTGAYSPVHAGTTGGMLPPIGNMLLHQQWNIATPQQQSHVVQGPTGMADLSTASMQLDNAVPLDPSMILNLDNQQLEFKPLNIESGDFSGALYDTNNLSENLSMHLSLSELGNVVTVSGTFGGRTYQNDSDSLTNLANTTIDKIYNNKAD